MSSDYFDQRPTPGRKYEAPLTHLTPIGTIDRCPAYWLALPNMDKDKMPEWMKKMTTSPWEATWYQNDREDPTMSAYPTPIATTDNVERIVHTTEYYTTNSVVNRYSGVCSNDFPSARAVQFKSGPLKGYVALRIDTTHEDWFLVTGRLHKIVENSEYVYRAFNPVYGSVLIPSSIYHEDWTHIVLNIPDDVEPVLLGGLGTSKSGWSNRALTHPGFDVGGDKTYAEQWEKAPYTVCDKTTLSGFFRRTSSMEE